MSEDRASRVPCSGGLAAAVTSVLSAGGQPPAWSMIVTVFGDAIVPRGGAVWTGSLITILRLVGYGEGVVRTALSRLVADGWLESVKDGRRSYHMLSSKGLAETRAAAPRIYRAGAPTWDGSWSLTLLTEPDAAARAQLRRRLIDAGWGSWGPETLLRPGAGGGPLTSSNESGGPAGLLVLRATMLGEDPPAVGAVVARAWNLEMVTATYRGLETRLQPLLHEIRGESDVAPQDALAARLVLIHEWRRAALRDPDLPSALLPETWIGISIRARIAEAYRGLLGPSEAWLGATTEGPLGPLPPAELPLARRFTDLADQDQPEAPGASDRT